MNPSAVEAADPSVTVGWLAELTRDHPETRVAPTLNPITYSDLLMYPTAARMAIAAGSDVVAIIGTGSAVIPQFVAVSTKQSVSVPDTMTASVSAPEDIPVVSGIEARYVLTARPSVATLIQNFGVKVTVSLADSNAAVARFSLVRILKKRIATADGVTVGDTLATGTAIYGEGTTDPNQISAGKVDFGRVDPIRAAGVLVSTGTVSGFCISQHALRPRLPSRTCGISTFKSARSACPTARTGEFCG